MKQIGNALWLYEKSGLQKTARKLGVLKKLPTHLGTFESIIPPAVSPSERAALPKRVPAKGTQLKANGIDRREKLGNGESMKQ